MTEKKKDVKEVSAILKASYKPQREAEADLIDLGYTYDPNLSTMENKVFVDKEKKPHIAYRGSVTVKDWLGNAKIALGFKDPEAEKRIQLAEKVKEKYGEAPTTYGHSRGGYIAERAGARTGGDVYTYNKATPYNGAFGLFKNIRPEQTDIRVKGDVVSLPSYFEQSNKITLEPTKGDALSAHQIQ